MAMVINTNIMSLNAQRNLSISQGSQESAMERLTSGKRINSAADDAAGLSIASGLTSQIKGLDQAIRNANDGVSLVQTAEGALQESTNILQRMRELSIQSANGTYTTGNRDSLQAEVSQLQAELSRIADTTTFNGLSLLDGTLGAVDLQVGSQSNQTIGVDFGSQSFTASSLGGLAGDVVGEASTGLGSLQAVAASVLVINEQAISSLTAITTLGEGLASINSDIEDYGASASSLVTIELDGAGDGVLRAGTTETVQLDLIDQWGATNTFVITGTESMDELVEAVNTETGGRVTATLDNGKMVLSAADALSLEITDNSTGNSATGADATTQDGVAVNYSLVLTDTSSSGNGVKIEAGTASTTALVQGLGINVHDDEGNMLGTAVTAIATNDLNEGDLIINGVAIGEITAATTVAANTTAVVNAINDKSAESGVVAYTNATGQLGLRNSSGDEISVKYGDIATDANVLAITGLVERNASSGAGSVASIDVSTAVGAQRSIETIDKALEQVNNARGEMGAVTNRLEYTVNNLSNVSQSASSSRSRIEDADFAAESAALSRSQVLQQAGTAMLAQANAAPQQVLSLIQ